jgi:hypothetical protein
MAGRARPQALSLAALRRGLISLSRPALGWKRFDLALRASAHPCTHQVHLVEFDTARTEATDLNFGGIVRSWTWASGIGWLPASSSRSEGLPGVGGFGFRVDPADLAREIVQEHSARTTSRLQAEDLLRMEPRLPYLLPVDLETLQNILWRVHRVKLRLYDDGEISESNAP